jgi:hypothetical protein
MRFLLYGEQVRGQLHDLRGTVPARRLAEQSLCRRTRQSRCSPRAEVLAFAINCRCSIAGLAARGYNGGGTSEQARKSLLSASNSGLNPRLWRADMIIARMSLIALLGFALQTAHAQESVPSIPKQVETAIPGGRSVDKLMVSYTTQGAGSVSASIRHFQLSAQARSRPVKRRASPAVASCIVNCIRHAGGTDPVAIFNACMGLCERHGGVVVF